LGGRPAEIAEYWRGVVSRFPNLVGLCNHRIYKLTCRQRPLKNFLKNGSFEADPAAQEELLAAIAGKERYYTDWNDYTVEGSVARDWFVFHRNAQGFTARQDPGTGSDGRTSLCLQGAATYGGVLQDVTPPANRARYRLSFRYRTDKEFHSGECGVAFYRLQGLPRVTKRLRPSPEWRREELEFLVNYPAEFASFTVALLLRRGVSEESRVWFDDVKLEMLAPDGVLEP
jgi:hypothetical protein